MQQPVADDGLLFNPETVHAEPIREEEEYRGLRIQFLAMLGNARIPIQVDIGFGDVITPEVIPVACPVLLGFPAPVLAVYPRETVVAEKFQAMVKLGITNSRMKDFHDVWLLASEFAFEGRILSRAIKATFERRRTALPGQTPPALSAEFYGDSAKNKQWTAFVRKNKLEAQKVTLEQVMGRTSNGRKPFRFLWNQSAALASNLYLLLFPKGPLQAALGANPQLFPSVFQALRKIDTDAFTREGRVYGGGLYKMEPKELARLAAEPVVEAMAGWQPVRQGMLFAER